MASVCSAIFFGTGWGFGAAGGMVGVELAAETVDVDAPKTSGVVVAITSVVVAVSEVEVAFWEAFVAGSVAPIGFLNEASTSSHVFCRAAGIAYAVAHVRIVSDVPIESTPPSDCCKEARNSSGVSLPGVQLDSLSSRAAIA